MENDELRDDTLDKDVTEEVTNEEDTEDTEDSVDTSEELEQARAEAAKWKAIAERTKKKQEKKPETKTQPDDDIRQTVQQLALAEEKRQFGYENNLSPMEVDAIFKINPKPTKETLNDPFIKGGLEQIRTNKRLEENTPRSKSSAGRITPKTDKPLSEADRQKEFEARRDEILAEKRGR